VLFKLFQNFLIPETHGQDKATASVKEV